MVYGGASDCLGVHDCSVEKSPLVHVKRDLIGPSLTKYNFFTYGHKCLACYGHILCMGLVMLGLD